MTNISFSFDASRDDKIGTCDLRSPRPLRYRAAPHPVVGIRLQEETSAAHPKVGAKVQQKLQIHK